GDGVVVVGLAIDLEVVGAAALSVGGETDAVCIGEVVGEGTDDAGNQESETIETAAGGQVGNLGGVEGGGDLGLSRLQQVLRGADADFLGAATDGEVLRSDTGGTTRAYLEVIDLERSGAGRSDDNGIG